MAKDTDERERDAMVPRVQPKLKTPEQMREEAMEDEDLWEETLP